MKNNVDKKRIGIYSPYLNVLGGGERYLLSIASCLSTNYDITVIGDINIKQKALSILNIPLNRIQFIPETCLRGKNLLKRHKYLGKFDIFIYMTDGSVFFPSSNKNFLIVQSPAHLPPNTIRNRLKLSGWRIICYSEFMKKIISEKLNKEALVIPPCIDTSSENKQIIKENIILNVGRFFSFPHNKKQKELIEIFLKHHRDSFKDWKLVIAGGLTEEGGNDVLNELRNLSRGFPVEIRVNESYKNLTRLYSKAKIYWHATGYGEDPHKHPERLEHFGITTLEAMNKGVVPVVYKAGGQIEIIDEGSDGYFWLNENELVQNTVKLMTDEKLFSKMSQKAEEKSLSYSEANFYEKIIRTISR